MTQPFAPTLGIDSVPFPSPLTNDEQRHQRVADTRTDADVAIAGLDQAIASFYEKAGHAGFWDNAARRWRMVLGAISVAVFRDEAGDGAQTGEIVRLGNDCRNCVEPQPGGRHDMAARCIPHRASGLPFPLELPPDSGPQSRSDGDRLDFERSHSAAQTQWWGVPFPLANTTGTLEHYRLTFETAIGGYHELEKIRFCVRRLQQHFVAAIRQHHRFTSLEAERSGYEQLLGQLPEGAGLIDAHGKIVWGNDKLCAMGPEVTSEIQAQLHQHLHSASAPRSQSDPKPHSTTRHAWLIATPDSTQCSQFECLFVRFPDQRHCIHDVVGAVFVSPSESDTTPCVEYLRSMMHLSPAECRVIQMIVQGDSLPQIAKRLHVSPTTVRTHVSRAFVKSSTGRQAELVARTYSGLSRFWTQPSDAHEHAESPACSETMS